MASNWVALKLKRGVCGELLISPELAIRHTQAPKSAKANQELFIFRKVTDGSWKIARYSFSTTNPPLQQ
jgi:hypothetical protein